MKLRYTYEEIAKASLCSVSAVKKAVERGVLVDDIEVVLGWVMLQRVKQSGLGALDVPKFAKTVSADNVEHVLSELHYTPDKSQTEGE